jgi:hypothetical protein
MRFLAVTAALLLFSLASPADNVRKETVLLDTAGYWRAWITLKPPVVREGAGVKPLANFCDTEFPPKDWAAPGFDDSSWVRTADVPFAGKSHWAAPGIYNVGFTGADHSSPCLALVCVRGKFNVTDPSQVKGLTLNVAYRGGFVAYVNGKEVARGHLPKDAKDLSGRSTAEGGCATLAEDYPLEAYVKPDGSLHVAAADEKDKENLRRWMLRTRKAEAIAVPAALLRKGVNVLAIEVHRAPYNDVLVAQTKTLKRDQDAIRSTWSTCGLVDVKLAAESAEGATPNVARPKGLQVWNSDVLAPDFDVDYGDPNETLRAVRIVGTRGGSFSGKVVVGSGNEIKGLRAGVGDFAAAVGKGKIAASCARVRYGLPLSGDVEAWGGNYRAQAELFDGLAEAAPDPVPVRVKQQPIWLRTKPGHPEVISGAVVPVWITVKVPADAAPGDYKATLTISCVAQAPSPVQGPETRATGGVPPPVPQAAGPHTEPIQVPIELKVCSYTLPPPSEFHTVVDFVESPESVAMQYKVPLWSDRHFELLGKSFDLLGEVGNWTVYVPLITTTNMGNEQSMVRWVKKPDGTYSFDFTVMDRYLDLAAKRMGKPRVVCLYVWDVFLGSLSWDRKSTKDGDEVPVSGLDPAARDEVTTVLLPKYGSPESLALWKTLGAEVMKHLAARGLDKAAVLGIGPDSSPSPAVVNHFKQVFPGVPWMRHSHGWRKTTVDVPNGYEAVVWSPRFMQMSKPVSLLGWKRPENVTQFCRSWTIFTLPIARLLGEMNITGEQRGFGRIGLDFWPVLVDKKGRRVGSIQARFPKSAWQNLDWMVRAFVPAGTDGAISSGRLEMMREGLEECEARIVLERAITDPGSRAKLGDKLAKRVEDVLAERSHAMLIGMENHFTCGYARPSLLVHEWWSTPGLVGYCWTIGSGWQERTEALFTVAAEVERAVGK